MSPQRPELAGRAIAWVATVVTDHKRPVVTEEAVSRLQRRIGIPERSRGRLPHNEFVTTDGIRHFALGYGDDNPLWCSREYGRKSCWGSTIAPPLFAVTCGVTLPVEWSPEEEIVMSGGDPLRGIAQFLRADRWRVGAPLRPGARLLKQRGLIGAELVTSAKFVDGRSARLWYRTTYFDDGPALAPVAVNDREYIYGARHSSGDHGRENGAPWPSYDDVSLEVIAAAYDGEYRRGSDPVDTSELVVGLSIPSIVRGPLTVTDVIAHHVGTGISDLFNVGPLALAYRNRRRIPGFYDRNEFGAYDVRQRCHWDHAYARQGSHERAYDYAAMRMNWMINLVTNWMGDAGWIECFEGQATQFNYVGDTQWIKGEIAGLGESGDHESVELNLSCTNQRGEVTGKGSAVVLLGREGQGATVEAISPAEAKLGPQAALIRKSVNPAAGREPGGEDDT